MTLSHNGKTNQPPVQVTGGCVFCLGGGRTGYFSSESSRWRSAMISCCKCAGTFS